MADQQEKTDGVQLIELPSVEVLLQSEKNNLLQMLKNIDGEMLQATVRRETILAVLYAVTEKLEQMKNGESPEPKLIPFPEQLEFDFMKEETEDPS